MSWLVRKWEHKTRSITFRSEKEVVKDAKNVRRPGEAAVENISGLLPQKKMSYSSLFLKKLKSRLIINQNSE